MSVDHDQLAVELVRALRGRRSQVALSRRMGCRSNVLYTWESGRRFPTAAVFFELAERVGVDVTGALTRFLGVLPEALRGRSLRDPPAVAALLDHLHEGTTVVELARRVGHNRVSVGRFLKGEAEPRLPIFLELIEATSLRLLDFVDALVPAAQLPAAAEAFRVLEAQRRVAYELPWSHAVLRVLELDAYRTRDGHDDGFVAARLGIGRDEVTRCLRALADSRLVVRRRGLWTATQVLAVDTRRNPDAGRALKRHWADVGRERLPGLEPSGEDLFSYNLFTVSERDFARLRELHVAYYQELRRVIEQSSPAERVAVVNLQLFRLDAEPR
jgi:transcriptional regulator with XRE-family HTH domain